MFYVCRNATREVVTSVDMYHLWMMMAKEQIGQHGLYFLWFLCCLELVQHNSISLTVAWTMDFLAICSCV